MTPGIVDFLLARIADDEEFALRYPPTATARPRALAECEGKRATVVTYRSFVQASESATDLGPKLTAAGAVAALELVLKYLALPYADHPDYREEWRP